MFRDVSQKTIGELQNKLSGTAPVFDPCGTCHKLHKDPRPVTRLGETSKTQLGIQVFWEFVSSDFPPSPCFFQGKQSLLEDLSSEHFFNMVTVNEEAFSHADQ